MSIGNYLDDTASLNGDLESSASRSWSALEDTGRLGPSEPDSFSSEGSGKMHRYAEGIIRFYRARTILSGSRLSVDVQRAWRYLERVSPHDLPAPARRDFLDLVYFMRQAETFPFDVAGFEQKVCAIAAQIDSFVDELNALLDRTN